MNWRKGLILIVATLLTPIAGCGEKREMPVTCQIAFRKDKAIDAEEFETREFLVNTKIYVHVSFNMTNYSEATDTVSFIVDIPGAQYYTTYKFEYGTKDPSVDIVPREVGGDTIDVIHLSDMQFSIPADKVPQHKDFIFAIAANQPCSNMSFEAKFSCDQDFFIKGDKKVFTEQYSFISTEGGE